MAWKPPWHTEGHSQGEELKSPFENGRYWGGRSGQALLLAQTKGKHISGASVKEKRVYPFGSMWPIVPLIFCHWLNHSLSFAENFYKLMVNRCLGAPVDTGWPVVGMLTMMDSHPQGPLSLVGVPKEAFPCPLGLGLPGLVYLPWPLWCHAGLRVCGLGQISSLLSGTM